MATNLCEWKICLCATPSSRERQKKGRLTIQCDELWSFVDNKKNKQWVWLALDAVTREIVGVYIGARDEESAQGLWDSLPPVYRQCAIAYTDFWAAYPSYVTLSKEKTNWNLKKLVMYNSYVLFSNIRLN